MDRFASFFERTHEKYDTVSVTLDTHQEFNIGHQCFWQNKEEKHPPVGTVITKQDVSDKRWYPVDPALDDYVAFYTGEIEKRGRYNKLVISPYHAILGSEGHAIYAPVNHALSRYKMASKRIRYVLKGSNPLTENFSAMSSVVALQDDPMTSPNFWFIQEVLMKHDQIVIAGESADQGIAETVRDIVNFSGISGEEASKKILILDDCTRPVPGHEVAWEEFIREFSEKGATFKKSNEVTFE